MNKINFNGELVSEEKILFNKTKRAFNYGDGFFETIRIVNGKPIFIERHFKRIVIGLKHLKINYSKKFNLNFLSDNISELININNIKSGGKIKVYIFRSGMGTYKPSTNDICFIIESLKVENNLYKLNHKGFLVDVFKDYKKQINYLSSFKSSSSLLYVLASLHTIDNHLDDSLILNENNEIIESSNSNIFILLDNKIITPPLNSGCISGIMRIELMNIINDIGFTVLERKIVTDDLLNSKEIFLSNVVSGINWVGGYKQIRYYNTLSKKIIKELNKKLVIGRI
ncbi:MAG: aminotransferase class IV [Flavobacteriales bacterium]|nr:aminotransferase class IV [Flavobacteriales bacterium]MDG1797378.1 aminotransferase class IV [Flavobacteriales bacterium]